MSTAHINRQFLAGAREAKDTEILAVASRDQPRADAYAREYGIERAYGSYEALLADPDVEAVYISLPNSLHIEWTISALEAGKHVLCEKPLSRRAEDVERAFDVAERNDRLLMEAFMYRHNPQTRRLTELVSAGAVGRVRIIRAAFGFVARDPANVRLSAALEGGALMDVGCYCVSGARLIAGEPERVAGEQALGGDGVDVAFAGVMRFADDIAAHFDAGLALASQDLLEVVGDAGTAAADRPLALPQARDRPHPRRPDRAHRDRARQLLPARGREHVGGDPRRGAAAARPRRRDRPGESDRSPLPGGRHGPER